MNAEEEKQIEILLNPASAALEQKTALTWIRNYLEEGDILNLPVSKRSLQALTAFSRGKAGDTDLRSRARRVLKEYARG